MGLSESAAVTQEYGEHSYLPFVHVFLLCSVLFDQVLEDLFQAFCIRLQCGKHFAHSTLDEHSIDHAEALPISWQGR